MLMHSNIPATQWDQVKAEIQKNWDKIDAAELEGTHGDVRAISHLVQKRYGLKGDLVDPKIDEYIERSGTAAGVEFTHAAASAGPADIGSSVDPSSLSASINQTSSGQNGRDSRAAEDVTTFEPKSYASSQGVMNDVEFGKGRSHSSSETGNSGGSETVKESARDPQRSSKSRSNARDGRSDPASDPRSTEDSSKGGLSS